MTKDEFQTRYHSYRTMDKKEVLRESMKVKVEDDSAVAVNFDPFGYGLMLKSAFDSLNSLFPAIQRVTIDEII